MGVRPAVLAFACPLCGVGPGLPCVRVGPTYVPGPAWPSRERGHCVMRNIGEPIAIAHNERIAVEWNTRPTGFRQAWGRWCPACRARPGHPCRRPERDASGRKGGLLAYLHPARYFDVGLDVDYRAYEVEKIAAWLREHGYILTGVDR